MELRELRYFLAIAKYESISRAAEALYVTQPNLSRQMKKLEDETGRQLFERGSRKITLTDAGRLLKKRAEEILELYDRAEEEIKAAPEEISGEVRIGGGESRAFSLIARAICAVQRQYPLVKFDVFSGDGEAVSERLDKGLIDFGIFIEPTDVTRYDSLRLPLCDRWGVLMRSDSPLAEKKSITAADLNGLPVIRSRHSMGGGIVSDWFKRGAGGEDAACTYNLLYNASLLVESGAGYAVGLEGLINTSQSNLCFRPLSPEINSHLDIAWKKYRTFSPAERAFLSELEKLIDKNSM